MSDTFRLEYSPDSDDPMVRTIASSYVGIGIRHLDGHLDIWRSSDGEWTIATNNAELYRGPFPTPDAIFQGFTAMVAKRLTGEES